MRDIGVGRDTNGPNLNGVVVRFHGRHSGIEVFKRVERGVNKLVERYVVNIKI